MKGSERRVEVCRKGHSWKVKERKCFRVVGIRYVLRNSKETAHVAPGLLNDKVG